MPGFISDLGDTYLIKDLVAPSTTALTSTGNSSGVDLQLTSGPVHVTTHVGTVTGTTPTMTVKLQESDDNSTNWTDVGTGSGANATPSITAAGVYAFSTNERLKRYVRAAYTIAGTSPVFPTCVEVQARLTITGSGSGTQL